MATWHSLSNLFTLLMEAPASTFSIMLCMYQSHTAHERFLRSENTAAEKISRSFHSHGGGGTVCQDGILVFKVYADYFLERRIGIALSFNCSVSHGGKNPFDNHDL